MTTSFALVAVALLAALSVQSTAAQNVGNNFLLQYSGSLRPANFKTDQIARFEDLTAGQCAGICTQDETCNGFYHYTNNKGVTVCRTLTDVGAPEISVFDGVTFAKVATTFSSTSTSTSTSTSSTSTEAPFVSYFFSLLYSGTRAWRVKRAGRAGQGMVCCGFFFFYTYAPYLWCTAAPSFSLLHRVSFFGFTYCSP